MKFVYDNGVFREPTQEEIADRERVERERKIPTPEETFAKRIVNLENGQSSTNRQLLIVMKRLADIAKGGTKNV